MIKWFFAKVLVGVLAAFLVVSGFNLAYAKDNDCPPGQEKKGWKCVDIEVPDGGGVVNTNNNNIDISNRVTNTTLIGIDVDNEIDMDQKQSQAQAAIAIQGQKQSANNEGNVQNVTIGGDTYEAKPNHIQGPGLLSPNPKLTERDGFSFRTMGSVWGDISGIGVKASKSLASDCSDAKVEAAVMYKYSPINYIRKATADLQGVFMGTIYVFPDGDDVTVAGMEGVGLAAAMELGATHASILYDAGEVADGSSWNIGLGGGASIVANKSGSVMVAPNGGTGFGSATAFNSKLPALIVKLYYDVTVIR